MVVSSTNLEVTRAETCNCNGIWHSLGEWEQGVDVSPKSFEISTNDPK